MSRFTEKTIYDLLPSIYRQKDKYEGRPLEALIEVLSEQIMIIERDIDRLYDNWFIETCDPWIIPYIGDLLGVHVPKNAGKFTSNLRSQIANTISYRCSKGTLSNLEQIANDTTKWNVRSVEFFKLLSKTQYLNHINLKVIYGINLRDKKILKTINTPFDQATHNIDVRNIASKRGSFNIQNLGFYFWRINALPVFDAPAFKYDNNGRFFFSQTGHDTQLFNNPQQKTKIEYETEEFNLPIPLDIDTLRDDLGKENCHYYYDEPFLTNKSITIRADGRIVKKEDIVACDLGRWDTIQPKKGKVAIDPVLGRIYFSDDRIPRKVYVSYYYGFSSEIGGGFFKRSDENDNMQDKDDIDIDIDITKYIISDREIASPTISNSINDAITKLIADKSKRAILLIKDSEVYQESLNIAIPEECEFLSIKAMDGQRPTILTDIPMVFSAEHENTYVKLDGILLGGKDGINSSNSLVTISKDSKIGKFEVNNCTFVPNYVMKEGRKEKVISSVNIESNNDSLDIIIIGSIVGPVIGEEEARIKLTIRDSIVDGTIESPSLVGHKIHLKNATIFGSLISDYIDATNTIFSEIITVNRTQDGCVRFCYIPEGSKTPMKYRCQPNYPKESSEDIIHDIRLKVKPRFVSLIYGSPYFAQLHTSVAKEIFEGGDNRSEIGVYNTLYQSQRLYNFLSSFDEYLRFGLQAGTFFVT